ncbi:hypothetical protein [Vibrio harveyi]
MKSNKARAITGFYIELPKDILNVLVERYPDKSYPAAVKQYIHDMEKAISKDEVNKNENNK